MTPLPEHRWGALENILSGCDQSSGHLGLPKSSIQNSCNMDHGDSQVLASDVSEHCIGVDRPIRSRRRGKSFIILTYRLKISACAFWGGGGEKEQSMLGPPSKAVRRASENILKRYYA